MTMQASHSPAESVSKERGGLPMKRCMNSRDGLRRLIDKHRKLFRIPENLDFYSKEDFLAAERKYLKFALLNGETTVAAPAENRLSNA